MTPDERKLLEQLDQMVMNASDEELQKIQEIDLQTQMDGLCFCDVIVNSKFFANQTIKQKTRKKAKQ